MRSRLNPGVFFAVVMVVVGTPLVADLQPASTAGIFPVIHWHDVSAQQSGVSLTVEPGLLLASGECLLPVSVVDAAGSPYKVQQSQLTLAIDDRQITGIELTTFAPVTGGQATIVALFLDANALAAGGADDWETATETFIRYRSSRALRAVYLVSDKITTVLKPGAERPEWEDLASLVEPEAPSLLWDNILTTLTTLARADLPERRVLLVVSDGLEGLASDHPMISCKQAALQMRIPIYCVILQSDAAGARAGRERLQGLAEGTGGRFAATDSTGLETTLQLLLAQINSVQGISFDSRGLTFPASVQTQLPALVAESVAGTIAVRPAYQGRSWLLVLLLGVVLVMCGLGLIIYFRGSIGELDVDVAGNRFIYRIPLSGATIGKATSNGLNLLDRRVSRNHAVIRVSRGQVIVTDLRSTNGTMVNNQQIRTAILADGDRIMLGGSVELVYSKKWRLL